MMHQGFSGKKDQEILKFVGSGFTGILTYLIISDPNLSKRVDGFSKKPTDG